MTVIINGSNTPTAGAVAVGDGTTINFTAAGTAGQILQSNGSTVPTWINNDAGTVTSASVISANGFAGTVATATTTPAITLTTSITGVLKGNGTALSAATAGTDYVAPSGALGTPSSGTLTNCTADGTTSVGFLSIPQNSQSAAYTTVLADSGKCIFHPTTDANARTFTIAANSSVAYPIGTVIQFCNMTSQVVSIAITTDTMYQAGTGSTGTRSLAQYGVANAMKLTSTTWLITGSGLT
jgi:hypothetical protein